MSVNTPVINFKPSKKQYQALKRLRDKTTAFVGYGGSAFSGKSYLMCYWLTIMCLGFPGTGWGLGRRQLTVLKKTTLLTLFKVFGECNLKPDIHYSYHQQLNIITLWNGSQIFLIDTAYQPSDPLYTRFGGLELTGLGIDESNETDIKAIEILNSRVGRRMNDFYGLVAKILETFNPDKGHVYQRYYKPWKDASSRGENNVTFVNDALEENSEDVYNYTFIKALPADNPSPEVAPYVKRLLATADKITIERLVYGNFEYDDDPQKLFDYNKIIELFTNFFIEEAAGLNNRYLTADIAYEGADIFTIGIWYGMVLKKVIAIDKINEVRIPKMLHELRIEHKVPIGNVIYDADGVKKFIQQSAANGNLLGAKAFHNNGKPLFGENYKNLKAQCYWKLKDICHKNLMFIADTTWKKQIIEELEQTRKEFRKDDKEPLTLEKKEKLKERLKRSPDFADMLMLRMLPELKPKEKKPKSLKWRAGMQ